MRVGRIGFLILASVAMTDAAASAGPVFSPTGPALLSTSSPQNDEDPSVLLSRDGKILVVWFSERAGNSDLYVTSTEDGVSWTPAKRVTTDPGGDFNPSLIQDETGLFHLAWFRWTSLYTGHIWYNSSPDGLTWDPNSELQVTQEPDVDDWVPTLTKAANGTLLVYFVSDRRIQAAPDPASQIYVATKRPGHPTWDASVLAAGINSSTEHDHLPFAARIGDSITLTWVRYDQSKALPWENPKSNLLLSTSTDGLNWSTPTMVTHETSNVVNLFPALFSSFDGIWSMLWLSTRLGSPEAFELPVSQAAMFPTGLVENQMLPAGYSHRVSRTPTRGVYLGVWVQGPDGARDVYYRFFSRPETPVLPGNWAWCLLISAIVFAAVQLRTRNS